MPKVRMRDPVRLPDGRISTCGDLLDAGLAIVTKTNNWRTKSPNAKRSVRTAYFCDLFDPMTGKTDGGWEIGKMAYESRLAQSEQTKERSRLERESDQTREDSTPQENDIPQNVQPDNSLDVVKRILSCFDIDIFAEGSHFTGLTYTVRLWEEGEQVANASSKSLEDALAQIDATAEALVAAYNAG